MGRNEKYRQVNATLGTQWDRAKELASETPLTASAFVRTLIKVYGEQLANSLNGEELKRMRQFGTTEEERAILYPPIKRESSS